MRSAVKARVFAIFAGVALWTKTLVSTLNDRANPTVLARSALAEIDFQFANAAHIAWLAVAMVVVDELHAVLCSMGRAGV